jgi:hypothetical protein
MSLREEAGGYEGTFCRLLAVLMTALAKKNNLFTPHLNLFLVLKG